jgi:hypothetical protein
MIGAFGHDRNPIPYNASVLCSDLVKHAKANLYDGIDIIFMNETAYA